MCRTLSYKIYGLLFAGLCFTACSLQKIEKESPQINELSCGTKFYIALPENHGDGYTSQLLPDYDQQLVDNLNTVWHGNEKGIYFNFNALAAGQTTLTFVKRRFTDTLFIKRYIVKISEQ